MSSSPVIVGELSIPIDRVVKELAKSARPGFYGQCEVRVGLLPEAMKGVAFVIVRSQKVRSNEQPEQVAAVEQLTARERAVHKVVGDIAQKLRLRLDTVKIVAHFADGMLSSCDVVDEVTQ